MSEIAGTVLATQKDASSTENERANFKPEFTVNKLTRPAAGVQHKKGILSAYHIAAQAKDSKGAQQRSWKHGAPAYTDGTTPFSFRV